MAEESGCQVYAAEYRFAPEWRFPTQLDEYVAVAECLHGQGGKQRGVNSDKVMGGGDSAGGNMTAAVSLRLRDEGKKPWLRRSCYILRRDCRLIRLLRQRIIRGCI